MLTTNTLEKQLAASQAREQQLREALKQVHEQCLYTEDDGVIGVTQEPQIDSLLFDGICKTLALPQDDTALRQWGAKLLRETITSLNAMDLPHYADKWIRGRCCDVLNRKADELEALR